MNGTHRLAIGSIHTRLDLGVDPESRALFDGTQQEGLKVQEHLVMSVSVASWLVRNDPHKVSVAATVNREFS